MFNYRILLLAFPYFIVVSPSSDAAEEAQLSLDEQVRSYEAQIGEFGKTDPLHPRALDARVTYANFLAKSAGEENCSARLDQAQVQIDKAKSTPITELLLPAGAARIAATEYSIHKGRADCTDDSAERLNSQKKALEASRRSVDAFAQALDFSSMATMQFNMAFLLKEMGDLAGAVTALEQAIEIDRTYGLKDDAIENYGYLLEWRDGAKDEKKLAALVESWPPMRQISFEFGWQPAEMESSSRSDLVQVAGERIKRTSAEFICASQIKREGDDFVISSQLKSFDAKTDAPQMEDDFDGKLRSFVSRAASSMPDMMITAQGDFKELRDLEGFSVRLKAEVSRFVEELVSKDTAKIARVRQSLEANITSAFLPAVLEGKAREIHVVETGMWTGAKLERGTWYEMPMVVSMAGTPQGFLNHQLRFVVTRELPCAIGGAEPHCVEIVIIATPDEGALAPVMESAAKNLASKTGKTQKLWEYWSETHYRIVLDPTTLRAYARDTNRYSYIGFDIGAGRQREIKVDRSAVTMSYR